MYLEKRHINESTVLDCFGKFEDQDHDLFMRTLEAVYAEGCRYVVVNLTSVYQLSDNIIGLLKFTHEYFTTSEGQLALVSPLSSVRRDLDQAEITSTIPTYLAVYDALHRRNAVVDDSALTPEPLPTRRPFGIPPKSQEDREISKHPTRVTEQELVGVGDQGQ
ncbi:STAS domain-containing protein [Candidatus Nitronereus thalassa]|uniref:STAS domain-containing protein n=1 Tax=Candidatus Nitronereus thalassa TaxID=3020898 RepID=A0ABU3K996_9BACT|nr:STAS domain-containing protein [Candidatus Nitronereus thalassa]MDT7043019.1 STAS domain-containing protein [Candidatus Nitronereus thalassa]